MNPIIIYTDGACSANGKVGANAGFGVHFPGKEYSDISEHVPKDAPQTNNVAELLAISVALTVTPLDADKVIYSDSVYSVKGINEWAPVWLREGRIQKQSNWEMFVYILDLLKKHTGTVNIVWIRRSSKPGNIVADSLAVSGKDLGFPEWSIGLYSSVLSDVNDGFLD